MPLIAFPTRRRSLPLGVVALIGLSASLLSAQTAPVTPIETEEVITLPEFRVSASSDDSSYLATESTSGTRVATSIINLPYSVQVMTEEFIRDFKLFDLDEQAPFIGGMAAGDKNQGGGGGTRLRGFTVPYFRNGFYRRQAPDSNSIARVEVVKGPQSAIYGRVSPGGVVNYISKKPLTKFHSGLSYLVGSYNYAKVDGFVTGPLVKDRLFYRIDATYYDFERPTDFWYNRTRNLSGGLTWKVSADTSLTLEHEHTLRTMNGTQSFTRWIDANGITRATVFDIEDSAVADRLIRYNTNGAHQQIDRLNDSTYLQLEHRFAPDLSLRASLGYSTRAYERHGTSTLSTWDTRISRYTAVFGKLNWTDETKGMWTGDRSAAYQTIDDLQYGAQIDLTKVWSGSAIRQRSLLTFDLFEDETKQKVWALSGTALNNELAALGLTTVQQQTEWKRPDPFNPAFSGYLPLPAFKPTSWSMTDGSTFNIYRFYYGGLFNHTAELLNGRLALTGSVRQDWAEFERQQPRSADPELRKSAGEVRKFTYSGGANYHIVPRKLVAYVSYGSSFDPAPQTDPNTGAILGNKTSKGGDIGLKGVLLDNTFAYTLSVYRVDQDNQVTDNPAWLAETDPLKKEQLARYVPGGSTRGEGVSLDVSGRVTPRLSLQGNVAWTSLAVTKNLANPALVGTKPLGGQNAPARSAGIGATYAFDAGRLKGLRIGANYQHAERFLRIAGTATAADFYLPEVNQVGVFVSYRLPEFHGVKATLSLNVSNLFDEQEITVAAYSPPGREFKLTADLKF